MKASVVKERLAILLRENFPERQIYIRGPGRVQFFTFEPSLQAVLAGCALILLGWAAFATVNVIFKDRTIAAKDHRYQEMEAAYEDRLSNLEISYQDLDNVLTQSEQTFSAAAARLKSKQDVVTGLLAEERQSEADAGPPDAAPLQAFIGEGTAPVDKFDQGASLSTNTPARKYSLVARLPGLYATAIDAGVLGYLKEISARAVAAVVDSVSIGRRQFRSSNAGAHAQHPALIALAHQTDRVLELDRFETGAMAQTEGLFNRRIEMLRDIVARTGINPNIYFGKLASDEGVGGPEIPLDEVRIEGISDPAFSQAYLRTVAVLDELHGVSAAVRHIPLAMPVSIGQFNRTSGFGPRLDPFTGRYAFHPGLDFGGPWGAAVVATAPGRVVFAGERGSYGNMVEIDHGMGIRTRYAHLSAITVRVGAEIGKGAVVGRVGSTGRSTGPHVHYEVWYDNTVRNPAPFIAAGGNTYQAAPNKQIGPD